MGVPMEFWLLDDQGDDQRIPVTLLLPKLLVASGEWLCGQSWAIGYGASPWSAFRNCVKRMVYLAHMWRTDYGESWRTIWHRLRMTE